MPKFTFAAFTQRTFFEVDADSEDAARAQLFESMWDFQTGAHSDTIESAKDFELIDQEVEDKAPLETFNVEVKTYINIHVRAVSAEAAKAEACLFVEGLAPTEEYVMAWAQTRAAEGTASGRALSAGPFDTEDTYYILGTDGEPVTLGS